MILMGRELQEVSYILLHRLSLFPWWEHFIPNMGIKCFMAVILHPAPKRGGEPREPPILRGHGGAWARGARIVFCDFSKDLTVSRQNALYIGVSRFLDLT